MSIILNVYKEIVHEWNLDMNYMNYQYFIIHDIWSYSFVNMKKIFEM